MPKVELHLHIEGSLEPDMMFNLAQRNNVSIPFKDVAEIRKAYNFSNLQDFLDIYYQGMNVLQTEQDFYDLTYAYLQKCAEQNVMHTEIFFDPQGHTERGISFDSVINGITSALDDGVKNLDISSEVIMCFLRHLSEESALQTLDEAHAHKDKIIGIGLDSSEIGHPPSKFKRAFAHAEKMGFRKKVAHAGEEGPPDYVWEALDELGVDRIDHGNRALEDMTLVKRLIADGKAKTICPLSNLKLCVVTDMKDHPLKQMLEMGLKPTVNSDDPSYFGGYMNENFIAVTNALDLDTGHLLTLTRNAIDASFADDARKQAMQQKLDDYAQLKR